MATEVWFRNPDLYIRECVELGYSMLAWDRGYLHKKHLDPLRFADLYFPPATDYRLLAVGDQGTAELSRGHGLADPVAVYPTWEYGTEDIDVLIEMLAQPAGDDPAQFGDTSLPPDERPVRGQQHRVVIIRPPVVSSGPGRKFVRLLQELQEEYSDAIIHLHGLYSFRVMFGLGFRSVDVDPRTHAHKGNVILPSGKVLTLERAAQLPQWVNLLGFQTVDLKIPRNRCMYNMKSAMWSAEHYQENIKFKSRESRTPEPVDPGALAFFPVPTTSSVKSKSLPATVGDKFVCNTCSLQDTCKYFRTGAVCSIPGSEPATLARFFKTRDSDAIIEGLGTLLAAQTHRLETGLENESIDGELDPEVTKVINSLFDRGVKLAKLVNPALAAAGAPRLGVQVNLGQGAATPQGLTARIVAELEGRGFSRDQITPELIMRVLDPEPPAIEVLSSVD